MSLTLMKFHINFFTNIYTMQRVYQQSLDTDIDPKPDHQKALDSITAISAGA